MKLEEQVVSLELSKRLKELGVKQESYFIWIVNDKKTVVPLIDTVGHACAVNMESFIGDYSAFTVAELGEMLPLWYYSKRIPDGSWSTDHVSRMDILNTNEKTEADSRAAMLIQIIERKIERL